MEFNQVTLLDIGSEGQRAPSTYYLCCSGQGLVTARCKPRDLLASFIVVQAIIERYFMVIEALMSETVN